MPEELPAPIGDDVDDILVRLSPATAEEYSRLKRELQETCRDIRRRYGGAVREALLRQKADEFQERLWELLGRVTRH